METIYVVHSNRFDYKTDLYAPLRKSRLNTQFNIILPHESSKGHYNSKQLFLTGGCQLVLAEISFPSEGRAIEMGWANAYGIPILSIHRIGSKYSGSIHAICEDFIEYQNIEGTLDTIEELIRRILSG